MKYQLFIFLFLTCVLYTKAQDVNPFESIGKPGKILTLSKGKYTELHVNDTHPVLLYIKHRSGTGI